MQYSRCDSGDGAPAVAFQVELGLERVVDRLDDLPERLEVAVSGPWFLALAGRAQQLEVGVGEGGLERLPVVVLVRHQLLLRPRGNQIWVGLEHGEQHVAFVGLGAGQRERHGQPRQRAHQVQAQAPEEARVRGAIAVLGPPGEVGTLRRFPRPPALDRGRVDHPHIIAGSAGTRDQVRDHRPQHAGRRTDPLVVTRLCWQIRKHPAQTGFRVAEEPGLGGESE